MELHDGLCQSLAGIAALSSTLSRRLAAHTEESATSASAAEITKLLNEAIQQARDLAHGLCPIGLNNVGLSVALETLAINIQHLFRVTCTFECKYTLPRLNHDVERHLFRIAQEAVNNAVGHGRADRIEINLSTRDGEGTLSIRDNGMGLPKNARNSEGLGLHTMFYRTRLIGGILKMRARTQRGLAVTCAFPVIP